jgi:type IV pilus assembly protein PilV
MKPIFPRQMRSAQGGVMLLEALLGLLIFSLGVLALVAMQAVSISNVSNAKYRVEAAFMAEEIMNYMWLDPNNLKLGYSYPGGNSQYLMNWVTRIQNPSTGLPGALSYPPTVVVSDPVSGVTSVTVTIRWKAPDALAPSNHIAMTYITP